MSRLATTYRMLVRSARRLDAKQPGPTFESYHKWATLLLQQTAAVPRDGRWLHLVRETARQQLREATLREPEEEGLRMLLDMHSLEH